MERILGIDTGTNSLGWAIVEKEGDEYRLLHRGTNIFSEGVKIEKGIESSRAAERTEHRAVRRHYWRRKVRKISLLSILVENHLCPPLSKESLREWRLKKVYPKDEAFMGWLLTEDKTGVNPYHFRYLCLTQKLDLSNLTQRYILGRALYHLNQRRGFLSNRKETTKASEGSVNTSISELTAEIEAAGCTYLGEYFYHLYEKGEKIRKHYTARKEHYLREFRAICEKQRLEESLVKKLEDAIFSQRPLKSQKGLVGTCTFEKGKPRCPLSHPLYEDFRMYAFLNNVKIQTPFDPELRPLEKDELQKVIPLFLRKSKRTFNFEDIAKKLAPKNSYCFYKDREQKPYRFNYPMDASVSGSIVNAQLEDIFGENWLDAVCEVYTLGEGKSRLEILNDVWHALFFFDDEDKLKEFAMNRLQLSEEDATRFSKITIPQDYASLSLKAICKILPFMRDYGLVYSHAVFLGNLKEVLPSHVWGVPQMRQAAIEKVIEVLFSIQQTSDTRTQEQCVKDFLKERYHLEDKTVNKLYHPSMIDLYPRVHPNDEGLYQLGSPRISSVRNPMAMHSLFRLRKVVNLLLQKGYIDQETTIHIEFSRDLNDANRRWAIQAWQRENEKDRERCKKEIEKLFKEATGRDAVEVSDRDILKYQLWEEQHHKCLYTGEEIGLTDFLGEHPKYDIEHTVPRSVGGDSTKMNLTLCSSRYNREVKKTKLPTELAEHEAILQRIEEWKERYEDLDRQIRKTKGMPSATKEEKDKKIRRRHLLLLQRDYWRGKYNRFTMTEVPEGFSRRQGTDISVISRYARLFLKSVFPHVYIVKGIATSDFRKIWGIQEEYAKKERVNHVHHCIDAITIACIGPDEYAKLAQYYHDEENHEWYGKSKGQITPPWATFVEDIRKIQDELLVAHYTEDRMQKRAKRYVRTAKGKVLTAGDSARASLHNDTYYGAICVGDEIKYVVRRPLDSLEEKDVKNIVDEAVRQKIEDAIATYGSLKAALEHTIWMNEDKHIPIKKVRVFTPSVTRPLNIRQQRDQSRHEYKRQYHVQNDRNYIMAIYIGQNEKGKEKREFELVSNLAAASRTKKSGGALQPLVPIAKNGLPLAYQLKIGTMVLLYEKSPEEVWESSQKEMQRRLYKVTGLSSMLISSYNYGTIGLVHQQEARPSTEVKQKNGVYISGEEFRSGIKLLHTQFKALVQGFDFEINDLGEIQRLR